MREGNEEEEERGYVFKLHIVAYHDSEIQKAGDALSTITLRMCATRSAQGLDFTDAVQAIRRSTAMGY